MEDTLAPLDAALEYAEEGMPVVPLHSINKRGHCTCGRKACPSPGKHPRTRDGLKAATTDPAQIKRWWSKSRWPNANIGGVGGTFLCLDIDPKANGHESLEDLIVDNAPLPDTAVVETGEAEVDGELMRGTHYWFRVPEGMEEDVATRAGIRPGVDVRAYRGYAVLPPSAHHSGVRYEWIGDETLVDAVTVPDWLLDLVPEVVRADSTWAPDPNFKMSREVKEFINGTAPVPEGEQRDFLTRAARSVLTTGKDVEETTSLLFEGRGGDGGIMACDQDPDDPWREDQVLALVEDVFRAGPSSGMRKSFDPSDNEEVTKTDVGNGERLIAHFPEGEIFHVEDWKKWYLWDGEQFRERTSTDLIPVWTKVTEGMLEEAWAHPDPDETKRLVNHALKSKSRPRIEAAIWVARALARQRPGDLNSDPLLLNVPNGVVDLKTGSLLEARPEYLMTKQARAEYHPDATSDLWDEFLERVIPEKALRNFIQKAFGYTLTGLTEEHKFFYLHGPPASGKSTLLETLSRLLGNYSETAEPATFMRNPLKTSDGPSEDLARLANARMVVTSEVESGMRFAEAHISKLTGGDVVTARFLHANSFSFRPQFKLWFSANHKPRITSSSRSGIWRRILIVPMEQEIPEAERDPSLARRLRHPDVGAAVLAWAVEGARLWYQDYEAHRNMEVPSLVRDEVEAYQVESDHVAMFLRECVERTRTTQEAMSATRIPPEEKVQKRTMFDTYLGWCDKEGRERRYTQHKLSRELKEHGLVPRQAQLDGKMTEAWVGVRLKGLPVVKQRSTSSN